MNVIEAREFFRRTAETLARAERGLQVAVHAEYSKPICLACGRGKGETEGQGVVAGMRMSGRWPLLCRPCVQSLPAELRSRYNRETRHSEYAAVVAEVLDRLGSLRAVGSEIPPPVPPELRERADEIRAAGGVARVYRTKHGSMAVMNVARIGSKSGERATA